MQYLLRRRQRLQVRLLRSTEMIILYLSERFDVAKQKIARPEVYRPISASVATVAMRELEYNLQLF